MNVDVAKAIGWETGGHCHSCGELGHTGCVDAYTVDDLLTWLSRGEWSLIYVSRAEDNVSVDIIQLGDLSSTVKLTAPTLLEALEQVVLAATGAPS